MTKRAIIAILAVVLALAAPQRLLASGGEGEKFSPKDMVMEHLADSYIWEITTIKGREIAVPLPVIVRSSTGWHVFMSDKICHGGTYEGLYIAEEGKYKDKIVEDVDGVQKRPIDISLTKTACGAILSLLVVLV
ncbi:MAG: F0F1 ATP synthase subunit A, partial [Bacteroidales bacterium]|nr:F0F1 ATP synthase subunit A [Bacteroidales bacterium]